MFYISIKEAIIRSIMLTLKRIKNVEKIIQAVERKEIAFKGLTEKLTAELSTETMDSSAKGGKKPLMFFKKILPTWNLNISQKKILQR